MSDNHFLIFIFGFISGVVFMVGAILLMGYVLDKEPDDESDDDDPREYFKIY